ncbi:MAG: hypothetical protein KAI41_10055, partial [Hyphomicrobiaceae bacterium]|nr:hypothetical protein [Hyphomicrobiaceae bacterium]
MKARAILSLRASTLEHPGPELTSPAGTTAAYVMGQFEKPNGGSAGAGNRETLAKLARLISVPDDAERADSALHDDTETLQEGIGYNSLSLTNLREPGTTQL